MSQSTWLKGPVCGVDNCRSRLYRLNAGRKFCQFGHVMEGNLEFEDDEDAYVQTKRLNILLTDTGFGSQSHASATPAASTYTQTKSRRLHGDTGKVYIFKCLQYILKRITPMVINYLYGGLKEDELNLLQENVANTVKLFWFRVVKKVIMAKIPAVIDLFSIIYLAIRLLNQVPVSISDYLFMIKNNKVPYVNASLLLPANMLKVMPMPATFFLIPSSIPLEDQFYRNMFRWVLVLELKLVWASPADSFHFQALQLFLEVRIPQTSALLSMYHNLIWKITDGFFKPGNFGSEAVAEVQAISAMFFVLNLYFTCSGEVVEPVAFFESLAKLTEGALYSENKFHRIETTDIFNYSEDEISKYCDWVYDTLIHPRRKDQSDSNLEYELDPMDKKLYKIFPFEKSDARTEDDSSPNLSSLGLVHNNLSKCDLAGVRSRLSSFFCTKFGLKESTLNFHYRKLELELFRVLRAEKLIR